MKEFNLKLYYKRPFLFSFTGFDALQILILAVLVILFSLTIVTFFYSQRILFSPLKHLSDSFNEIAGDKNYRIKETSEIYEIRQFYSGFNNMLDSIQEAENETHKQQMDAAQAKLQYLQLQIRPHFYLNCLKNINSLAEIHEDEKIQDLVISLSDYFRYNFQDVKNFVTLQEEFSAVQSYIDLCRCLYNEIELEFDVESDVLPAKCLPLSILTFVENSIKHGKDLKELLIRLHAKIFLNEEGEAYVYTEIGNTGEFSKEALESLNAFDHHRMVYQREKVGIANVCYRMWLIYGDDFKITFENKDGLATVSLLFPIIA